MKIKYKFIEFVPHETWKDMWECRNRKSGDVLGYCGEQFKKGLNNVSTW